MAPGLPTQPEYIRRFDRYFALRNAWDFSREFIHELSNQAQSQFSENVLTVALAGSFGRLEASKLSDADYILIVKDPDTREVDRDLTRLRELTKDLGVSPPNKSGVFAKPRSREQLLEQPGDMREKPDILSKRMLLILETKPVYGFDAYERLLADVFVNYAKYVIEEPTKEFVVLLNDLIRYFRFVCINYESSFWRENEKWPIRNVKLRHSRILMYAGTLFLIGEMSKYADNKKVERFKTALRLTPLDRLAWIYSQNGDHSFFRVASIYDTFLRKLSNPDVREELNNVQYEKRYENQTFSELKSNSDALVAELTRFVWSRRGQWSERFFEYILF